MSKEAGKTGAGPTSVVAMEQYYPQDQRIVVDELAFRMLPFGLRAFVWLTRSGWVRNLVIAGSERDLPGIWSGMLCRKRYIDERLFESVGDIDAVVNLGAGLDTRAYRLPTSSDVAVWEVDQPGNIRQKRARVEQVLGEVPPNVHLVPMDFDRESLSAVLQSHGYSACKRTFFIWEGVTQYLTEMGLQTTFDFLSRAGGGSRLAFTYVRKDFIDGRLMYGWEKAHKKYVAGAIWLLGLEPEGLPDLLGGYGWRLANDIAYDELAERFVKPTGRMLTSTSVERVAFAEKL